MAQLQITVDDGPQPVAAALDPILAELRLRRVRAAFFNIGSEVQADGAATRKIRDDGHTLGNHSFEHLEPSSSSYTDGQIRNSFEQTHNIVIALATVTMRHWRAPRLEQITRLQQILTAGANPLYTLSHCDVHADSKDSQGNTTAASMLASIRAVIAANPQRTSFRLLFHTLAHTATALPTVLSGLVADGHSFVNFSQTS